MDVDETNAKPTNPSKPAKPTNPLLVQLASQVFGAGRRVLITGGTGFVGSCLAQVLHDADQHVTISGRSRFRVRSDGQFVAADIANRRQVEELCRNQEFVFHTAALTSPWGELSEHRKTNVDGTQHVVDACARNRVQRLVHVSSTAIYFQFQDQCIDDDTPLPDSFCCHYAQSKAEAEHVVRAAMKSGLNSYIVRARAVFGPGDNALLPRLLKASERGKLRQIGHGKNLCDLTYIDNLLAGLILAADPERPQGTCTITNEEPVNLWDVLHRVLHETVPNHNSDRRISYPVARRVAHAIELKHRLLGSRGEPMLTRYGVGLLAFQQTFQSQAARDQLDYSPIVPMDEAIDRTIRSLKIGTTEALSVAGPIAGTDHSAAAVSDATCVSVKFFSTGFIEFPRNYAERGATKSKTRFHATIALIQHPEHGPILFDAGYTQRFFDATRRWPYRLYRWATKVTTRPEWEPAAWLKREAIRPDELKLLMISHFHGDHICGLDAFPNAEFLTLGKAWESARDRSGLAALKRAILPDLLPDDFADRVHTIHEMHSRGVGPFLRCHDLFRDGSIRLFDLDGHAEGQMGALLNAGDKQYFLTADAFWSRTEIEKRLEATGSFRMIADNYDAAAKTRQAICQLAEQIPTIEFVCTHCPEFAREQRFDASLEAASRS